MSALDDNKRTRIIKLLDAEAGLLSKYEEQTELQSRLLDQEEIEAVGDSLDRRQAIIEQLGGLHQELEVLMQSYMSAARKDKEIDRRRETVNSTIKALLKQDAKLRDAVKKISDEYAKEIRGLSENRRGLDGYKIVDTGHSGIFDKST